MAVGLATVNGSGKSALPLVQQMSKDHDIVLKTFRMLISDLCQQFGGGHPGYVSQQTVVTENTDIKPPVVPLVWPLSVSRSGDM